MPSNFSRSHRTGNLLDLASSSRSTFFSRRRLHHVDHMDRCCALVLPCIMWIAHYSAQTPWVLKSKPTHVHPSPPRSTCTFLLTFTSCSHTRCCTQHLHFVSQEIHHMPRLPITYHPKVTTIDLKLER